MTSLEAKLRRIEALRSENEEDAHPSFVRIEAAESIGHWETDTPVVSDALGSAEKFQPSLGSMLIPAMVLLAFALGWLLAALT